MFVVFLNNPVLMSSSKHGFQNIMIKYHKLVRIKPKNSRLFIFTIVTPIIISLAISFSIKRG